MFRLKIFKKFKTALSMLIVVTLAFGSIPVTAAASDIAGHWAESNVTKLTDRGILNTYSDGTVLPDTYITRKEFISMINNLFGYVEKDTSKKFSDIDISDPFYAEMQIAATAGFAFGYVNGTAQPDAFITREEASAMFSRTLKLHEVSADSLTFSDSDKIQAYAKEAVASLSSQKVINGYPDGSFKPQDHITRAEAATIVAQFAGQIYSKEGKYNGGNYKNVFVNTSGVTLSNMTIDGDLYITQGVDQGEVTLSNVTINGDVIAEGGGVNSIIFNNVDVKGALVVNKYDGKIRILATGKTSVSLTVLESGALLVTRELTGGGFELVEISADIAANAEIVLDGSFKEVINNAAKISLTVNGTVSKLTTTEKLTVKGNAKITSSKGSVTIQNNSSSTGSSSTSSSSGNSGNNNNDNNDKDKDKDTTVSVTSVAINESAFMLAIGETKSLTATVYPENATNKDITWSSSSEAVATVDAKGVITGVSEGEVTITVKTANGSKTSTVAATVYKPSLNFKAYTLSENHLQNPGDYDTAILNNNSFVGTSAISAVVEENNTFSFRIQSMNDDAMLESSDGKAYVDVLVDVSNDEGNPVDASITVPASLEDKSSLLKADSEGQFALRMEIVTGSAIDISTYEVSFAKTGYSDSKLMFAYLPEGVLVIDSIGNITGIGEPGSTLTAGVVNNSASAVANLTYSWYRSSTPDGVYSLIRGVTGSTYTLSNADGGKYIKVSVSGAGAYGSATSAAFGPIAPPVDADEIWAAIEADYLGNNNSASSITSNLSLRSSLAQYPGVSISWSVTDGDGSFLNVATGAITRQENADAVIKLTATLTGKITDSRDFNIIIRMIGLDNVELSDFVDPAFKADYPRAFFENGNLYVEYELNTNAEVYMIVNSINPDSEADVKAVLEGRTGKGDTNIIPVDSWPYFESTANVVNRFYTGLTTSGLFRDTLRIDFVLVYDGYTSPYVTEIMFDKEVIAALDQNPPRVQSYAYVNQAKSNIYLYFDDFLDAASANTLAKDDFTVKGVTLNSVSWRNADDTYRGHYGRSVIILNVSDINFEGISISYNGSGKIKDTSDAKNATDSFTIHNSNIKLAATEIVKAVVSSDRKNILVEIQPGHDFALSNNTIAYDQLFSISIGGQTYKPESSRGGFNSIFYSGFRLNFSSPLPSGAITVTMIPTGMTDWAFDDYPATLTFTDVTEIPTVQGLTASYSNGSIIINFPEGFSFDSANFAGDFTITADGTDYTLRGFIMNSHNTSSLNIILNETYSARFKTAVENASTVTISYTPTHGSASHPTDGAGANIPAFGPITVNK